MRAAILFLGLTLFACAALPSSPPADEAREIDSFLERLEAFGMHGQILVARGGEVILHEGYGYADDATGRPITKHTLFNIGSLAKQFTAAAVLKLRAAGALELEDPIERHLTDLPLDKRGITIHQLLTHTSGLPYHDDPDTFLRRPLAFQPGTEFSYSNPGYMLLARIVEAASGRGFTEFVQEEIFDAAGLEHTVFLGHSPWPSEDNAHAYTDGTDQGPVDEWELDAASLGPGGVASNTADLHRWERSLATGRVLPAEERRLFRTPHVEQGPPGGGYAYGWMTYRTERDTRVVMHQGNHGGFNADHRRYLDEDITLIFLSNRFGDGRSMRDAVVNDVSRILSGGDRASPPATLPESPRDLSDLEGVYELVGTGGVSVEASDAGLSVTGLDQSALTAIFSPDATADELLFLARSNQRGEEALSSAMRGDFAGLDVLMANGLPQPATQNWLRTKFQDLGARFGRPRAARSIGTALAGDDRSGRTWVELEYEHQRELLQLTWDVETIIHLTTVEAVAPRRFLPRSDTEFVAYDLFTQRTATLTFEEPGTPRARVTIHTPAGPLVATRVTG